VDLAGSEGMCDPERDMEPIRVETGLTVRQHKYLPTDKLIWTAQADGRTWAVKTPRWPSYACVGIFSIRLGMEAAYYSLAKHNHLPMPESGIILLGGTANWGTEIIDGRTVLGKGESELAEVQLERVKKTLAADAKQVEGYLRATFLDAMLLNRDRTISNVLMADAGDLMALSYFDHEQSLGWANNIQAFGRNRIHTPEVEFAAENLNRRLILERKFHWGAAYSTPEMREKIFRSLDLRPELLDEVHRQMPGEWIYPDQLEDMKKGLVAWWKFLREQPFKTLDARLFPV
jgi:hypothetical protein